MNWIFSFPRLLSCSLLQHWTPSVLHVSHSLDGKLAIVTGGNSGIGLETCKTFASQGCHVVMLCRNTEKAIEAVHAVNKLCRDSDSVGYCESLQCDLADLASVQRCIELIRDKWQAKKIDFFLCNGGIMMQAYSRSAQGYEIHFATNHLGHVALVGGMIDILCNSKSKVVVLTGDIAILADDASADFVYDDSGLIAYCRSKICNQSFVRELHKRYGQQISCYAVHPGVVDSNLVQPMEGILGSIEKVIRSLSMIDCRMGAQSSLCCCLTDNVPPGSYFHNVFGTCSYHPTAGDDSWSEKLWNDSIALIEQHGVNNYF